MAASSRFDLSNWAPKQHVTLMEAFGISKGTVDVPKVGAQLPGVVAGAKTATTTPKKHSQPPSDTGSGNTSAPGKGSAKANYDLAVKMAAASPYNWTGAQMTALNDIVMAESGWSVDAQNPSSSAYGIPQALPGSKMASAGSDWKTNPATQIKWMLGYIRSRYGDPISAWQFHLANGWY